GTSVKAINCGISRLPESLRTPPMRPTLLCLGRTESIGVKGLDIFAYAAAYLSEAWMSHPATRERPSPQFVVRGVRGDEEAFERHLIGLAEAAGSRATIIARPYTAALEELAADYRGATAFLMPSREEGFGLVACEALSHGVPILVSENSGIAEVIRETALANHMDVSQCVISMGGDPKAVGRRFADAALEILIHEERAVSFSNMLSERLIPVCSWEFGAQQFLLAIEEVSVSRKSSIPAKPLVSFDRQGAEHDASSVLNDNRPFFDSLPGLLTISVQEVIVVTFERGRVPIGLPSEIVGVPLVVREGNQIQQTANIEGDGDLLVGGKPIGSVGIFSRSSNNKLLALTAAHVLQAGKEDIKVRIGEEIVPAEVVRMNSEFDWAVLSLPFVNGARSVERVGNPVLGQAVRIRVSDRLIRGTISVVQLTALSVAVFGGNQRTYDGLFEVTTSQEVPSGSSGALVVSDDGRALGMLVAGARGAAANEARLFAIPLRTIMQGLDIRLVKPASEWQVSKVAVIPTDEMSLQGVLRSIGNVEQFTHQSRRYFRGRLDGERTIVISPVPRVGNIGAAAATTALILDNDVASIFVVGLCGGLAVERQALADVVVSSDVIYYEPGVIGPDGSRQRLRISGMTPPSILKLARELAVEYSVITERPIGIHIGSIASGEKIIKNAESLSQTLSNWSNVVAVEMEGAGVFEAVASMGQDISIAIVRGISDFADANKIDDARPAAAQNAVTVALELIRRLPKR
ncbi:MAG: glycosyltransferase, partial [Alphaproteobacteria bacterium]|nr:glycosyltransferase [Alphaproteobacteria bacterium]